MTVIIRQSLDYLVELGELPANPFSNFKINSSLFTPVVPKESEYEVFNEVEEQQIKALALEDFEKHPHSTSAIALIANFSLGLRVGELVALKWKDLKSPYLQIRRMEQKQYDKLENGDWKSHLEVVEHTKTVAGYRTIYVVSSALELFEKVKEDNMKRGYSCEPEDYIFLFLNTAGSIKSL